MVFTHVTVWSIGDNLIKHYLRKKFFAVPLRYGDYTHAK